MDWRDRAIVLANRTQGENHSLLTVFTPQRGKVSALVYGGQGKGKTPILQTGNGIEVRWRGKSADSLGHFDIDLMEPRASAVFGDPKALSALTATAELLLHVLPEGEGVPGLFEATEVLFDTFGERRIWPVVLAKWEVGLLSALGGGLTLDRCVATDRRLEDGAELCFVSPKSGGAVSYEAGLPYKDKMLPLPPFLIDMGEPTEGDVKAALALTGYFVTERLLAPIGRTMPEARERLPGRL
ncbi:DNA repair protein RecO [Parvularcula lutaonensis]|uniref:DNA repair protein RecO n=1 Tax=Parvularcula lutaonensis TaxID=491923 RepID=A0ABV7MGP5_9PROT|nr:DNA repair protein RecO [Parvularcula lutaonensis]GGY52632.1 DNA repair protein RecO [Parvularcula lutaonensis]